MSGATDWLRFARVDLAAARVLADADVPPRTAAWNAQQAAEKALKAVLVSRNELVPRTHDLLDLASRARLDVARMPSTRDLADLSFHAVPPRYPDDFFDVEPEDAHRAIQTAAAVLAEVGKMLGA